MAEFATFAEDAEEVLVESESLSSIVTSFLKDHPVLLDKCQIAKIKAEKNLALKSLSEMTGLNEKQLQKKLRNMRAIVKNTKGKNKPAWMDQFKALLNNKRDQPNLPSVPKITKTASLRKKDPLRNRNRSVLNNNQINETSSINDVQRQLYTEELELLRTRRIIAEREKELIELRTGTIREEMMEEIKTIVDQKINEFRESLPGILENLLADRARQRETTAIKNDEELHL